MKLRLVETYNEEFPKDDYMIDPENSTNEELEKGLSDNNDRREHSKDFNKFWLDIYKYLQNRK